MTTLWAILYSTFYIALMLNGWMRVNDYVDGHCFVAIVWMNE
jgi:hypothetical protein